MLHIRGSFCLNSTRRRERVAGVLAIPGSLLVMCWSVSHYRSGTRLSDWTPSSDRGEVGNARYGDIELYLLCHWLQMTGV